MDKFGLRLENLREQCGYTKKEVSFKLGFSANVYGSYEREERRPSLETLIKLSDLYNVSLDYLIRGKEFKKPINDSYHDQIIENIVNQFKKYGIENPFILRHDKWLILNKKELEELTNHFEWVVAKAEGKIT